MIDDKGKSSINKYLKTIYETQLKELWHKAQNSKVLQG